MRDIHNHKQTLDTSLIRVKNLSLSNQKVIKKFIKNCELEEVVITFKMKE